MKLKNVAIGALIASSAMAAADDEADIFDELVKDDKSVEADDSKSKTKVDHPAYTPYEGAKDAFFFEQFTEGAEKRWKPSVAKKNEEFSYVGKWGFEEATVFPGFKGDRGLVVKSPAAHHAITTKFKKPFDNKDNTLVAQYEVKLQKGLECGGAYMKLLSENKELHAEEFKNDTPFQIMFGPDKCGSTNKVHFIIRRQNPKTKEYEEKHLAMPPVARLNKLSNLYTLVINPDQTFEIRVNGEVARAGNLIEDGVFKPSFNPPEEIDDENDTKPSDWVDDEYIPDPEQAEKPEDWDEDAPFEIADPEAKMPEDWLEDEPTEIPDPDAEIPEDWDEEEDGEWIAPMVDNPKCDEVSGCGKWSAPMIRNPDFKGKWIQPKIKNPDYKGEWAPRKIKNPDFYNDTNPSDLEKIGAIGFELWTMQEDILFDNIYLGHSLEQAEEIGNATFVPKLEIEKAEEAANAPEPIKKESKQYESAMEFFREDPIGYLTEEGRVFLLNLASNPKLAITNQPLPAAICGLALILALTIGGGLLNMLVFVVTGGSKKQPAAATKGKKAVGEKSTTEDSAKTTSSSSQTSATKRKA